MVESRPVEVLPGEQAVASALLQRAVEDINRIHARRGMELIKELGKYLLHTFFGGDIRTWRERQGRHQTFRALARREDLQVSYATLWYAVAVLEQLEDIPEHIATQLSFSHHRLLLPLKDNRDKLALARRAVDERLTTRQLERLVKSRTAPSSARTGRPRIPALVKGVRKVRAAVELATSEDFDNGSLERLSSGDLRNLLSDLRGQITALNSLAALVEEMVPPTEEDDD